MRKLRIAKDLALPAEAVTQTFGILAKRGAGKTYTASVMVEEMIKAGLPVVIIDPLGAWHGLRSSADGTGPGLPVVILGGEHGDIPLESTGGAVVADLLVDSPTPTILDLSEMRKGEARRFVTDFLERLYHRNRAPLHVVLDEADSWAPQRPVKGAERLLGAVEDLVRRGRGRGLGVTLICQRAAVLHKDVLTQIEVLVVLRITGPQDRDAVGDWIKHHDVPAERAELLASLAKLPIGTAWWWSPGWLDLFVQVKVRARETFDSSATPEVGKRVAPRVYADVDLEALKEAMAATIERAQADDPRLLRGRITQLEQQLAAAVRQAQHPGPVEQVEVPVLTEEMVGQLQAIVDQHRDITAEWVHQSEEILERASARLYGLGPAGDMLGELRARLQHWDARHGVKPAKQTAGAAADHARRQQARKEAERAGPEDELTDFVERAHRAQNAVRATIDRFEQVQTPRLGKAERALLTVLAQHPHGRTRVQLAISSGYSIKSSSLSNALGALRSAGYVTPGGAPIQATQEGLDALGPIEPLPAGPELYRWWRARLNKAERAVLEVLVDVWPEACERDELAARSGYSATSSSLSNALGKLRSLQLVEGWRANDDLMASIR